MAEKKFLPGADKIIMAGVTVLKDFNYGNRLFRIGYEEDLRNVYISPKELQRLEEKKFISISKEAKDLMQSEHDLCRENTLAIQNKRATVADIKNANAVEKPKKQDQEKRNQEK